MIYINQTLYLESAEYIRTPDNPNGLVSLETYKKQKSRGTITVLGRGGNGNSVLIAFESLPADYKVKVNEKYGDPYAYAIENPIKNLISPDPAAINFFEQYRKDDGKALTQQQILKYSNSASILNAIKELLSDKRKLKGELRVSMAKFWGSTQTVVKGSALPHCLPSSYRRLRRAYSEYLERGYTSLISGKIGNTNSRKVNEEMEQLMLSLYSSGKLYTTEVQKLLQEFLSGKLDLADTDTGEVLSIERFAGQRLPSGLSKTTVWQYINKPYNRITVDKMRVGSFEFNNRVAPHNHRHAPVFALSKISMDDVELPFKLPYGGRVKCYQIVDVASGCIIGSSFGLKKGRRLFIEAVKNMFQLIHNQNWGMPAEIEVEHNIASTFRSDLLKAESVFPFVRFCRPRNPQEKRAEHTFRHKKYSLQKQRPGFQGRFYGRQEATRANTDQDIRLSYEEIVANEMTDISTWNNSLHPDKRKYPGLTRWQVLCQNQNPTLATPTASVLSRYIGKASRATITRNQYISIANNFFALPEPEVLQTLDRNQRKVNVHYLPAMDGEVEEVHIYQDYRFICTCKKIERYNEAIAERTEKDNSIRVEQTKYSSRFAAMVKRNVGKLTNIVSMQPDEMKELLSEEPVPLVTNEAPKPKSPSVPPPVTPSKNQPDTDEDEEDDDDAEFWKNKASREL